MNYKDIANFSSNCNDAESAKHKQVTCRDKNKFKCACGKVYSHYQSVISHINSKTKSYTCPHCSKVISDKRGFKYHLDNRVCRRDKTDDDDDDDDDDDQDDDDDDELILGKKRRSSSNSSSRNTRSRPLPVSSNARGIVIIIS